jgi:Tfp pilus assembly protein PilV
MARTNRRRFAFALYEVLIGLAIFVVGILALGRSIENCLAASALSEQDDRIRLILSNRMAEIQVTPGMPDESKQTKVESGFGTVTLIQKTAPANLKDDQDLELPGIQTVSLTAQWTQRGAQQTRKLEFYVYRAG